MSLAPKPCASRVKVRRSVDQVMLPATLDSYGHVGNMAPPFGALVFAPTENQARVTPTGRRGVPMRLPSRPRFELLASRFAVLAFALAVVAVGAGCEDKHVGRPCDLGISSDGGT